MITPDNIVPPEVEIFLKENGVTGSYRCIVHKWSPEHSAFSLMKAFTNKTPSAEEVVRGFGTGEFKWVWSFMDVDEATNRPKPNVEFKQYLLGNHWEEMFEDAEAEREEVKRAKLQKRYEKSRLENMYLGKPNSGGDPMDVMMKNFEFFQKMMPPPQPLPQRSEMESALIMSLVNGKNNGGIETLLLPLMMEMLKGKNNLDLALLTPKNDGDNSMKMMEMFLKGMEVKKEMNEPAIAPPTTFQEILSVVKEVAPDVIAFMSRIPPSMRSTVASASLSAMPKGKEIKQKIDVMKANPQWLENAVNTWDRDYTPEQVDMLLASVGAVRPESTMGNYAKYESKKEEEVAEDELTQPAHPAEVAPEA